jgi:hypothetical protein
MEEDEATAATADGGGVAGKKVEWEKEGLGRGLEERLENLLKVSPPGGETTSTTSHNATTSIAASPTKP